jgi:hypothetical protein
MLQNSEDDRHGSGGVPVVKRSERRFDTISRLVESSSLVHLVFYRAPDQGPVIASCSGLGCDARDERSQQIVMLGDVAEAVGYVRHRHLYAMGRTPGGGFPELSFEYATSSLRSGARLPC